MAVITQSLNGNSNKSATIIWKLYIGYALEVRTCLLLQQV